MVKLRGADIIIEVLAEAGVEYMVGVPGHTVIDILDSLRTRQEKMKAIVVRNEESSGYIADAYFRISGKPMAVLAHNSVGAANTLTGVMNAMLDSSAMIVITGDAWTQNQGRGAFQELSTSRDAGTPDIFRGSVKRSWQVNKAEKLPEVLLKAYKEAVSGRPGPVHIDVTQEALAEWVEVDVLRSHKDFVPNSRVRGDAQATREALGMLRESSRPVILAGGGVTRGKAGAQLVRLAEMLNVPVTTTSMGKGTIPDDHPLHLGVQGWVGTVPANGALRDADVILAFGCRFSETDTAGWTDGAVFSIPPTRLIQVDIDPVEIARYYPVAIGIVGHAGAVLEDMIALAEETDSSTMPNRDDWFNKIEKDRVAWAEDLKNAFDPAAVPIEPGRLTQELRKALPRDGIMMTDVGNSQKWIIQQFPIYAESSFITSLGGASMGFGPGGALGAKLAAPERKVAIITGDGSMSMSLHILPDLVEAGLPIVYIVANDSAWASVNGPQQRRFGAEGGFFTLFKKPDGRPYYLDFSEVAKACGMEAEHVSNPEDLEAAFDRAFACDGPYLIDVTIRRDTYVPMTAMGAYPLPPTGQ